MKYTVDQIREIALASNDIKYFAENFVYINTATETKKKLESVNDYQLEVLESFSSEKFFEKIHERQTGKTLIAAVILLHSALFKENIYQGIVSLRLSHGADILRVINEIYEYLPEHIKVANICARNRSNIDFDNGSRIFIGSKDYHFRGMGITTLYFDEYRYIKEYDKLIEYLYPVVCSGNNSRIFALSSM